MNAESKNKHLISYLRLLVKIKVDYTPPPSVQNSEDALSLPKGDFKYKEKHKENIKKVPL